MAESGLPNAGFGSALSAKGMVAFWDAADRRLRALMKLSQAPIRAQKNPRSASFDALRDSSRFPRFHEIPRRCEFMKFSLLGRAGRVLAVD
ncbi:hypothetical protein C1879_00900 [Paraeggerthella hongkongensis]|nr:hypothetical protein C1879_00900 [Paraeggerthella hongkongensis]